MRCIAITLKKYPGSGVICYDLYFWPLKECNYNYQARAYCTFTVRSCHELMISIRIYKCKYEYSLSSFFDKVIKYITKENTFWDNK